MIYHLQDCFDIEVRISEDAEGCFLPVTPHLDGGYYHGHRGQTEKLVFPYSTVITYAWLVVEKIGAPYTIQRMFIPEEILYVSFGYARAYQKTSSPNTAEPLMICRAAIKAVENK